jgi:MOSC domain-containing protein YiiM
MAPQVVSVNLAHVIDTPALRHGGRRDVKPRQTGIDKRPVTGPVRVEPLGLVGDSILDTRNHGGLYQAVYAYAAEDLAWWQSELADEHPDPIVPGSFGENLTVEGVDGNGARAGDRWAIGSVVLEVTRPRVPCSTFAGFMDVPHWIKRFALAYRPGAYLRVVVPGELATGDTIDVTDVVDDVATLRQFVEALYRES